MKQKIHRYESDDIEISYDVNRCIHAKECVKGLRAVFDPDQRPWIQPGQARPDQVAKVVEQCPTGALHYRRKDQNEAEKGQKPAPRNTIAVVTDGPVYFRGELEVRDHKGEVVLRDQRFALCRCGQSSNKPACDNSHRDTVFEAPTAIPQDALEPRGELHEPAPLVLKLMKNGPVLVEGSYEIYSDTCPPSRGSKNIALCRCGSSANKPFCDGSHKEIGFMTEE